VGTKFTLSALRKATLTSKFISFVPLTSESNCPGVRILMQSAFSCRVNSAAVWLDDPMVRSTMYLNQNLFCWKKLCFSAIDFRNLSDCVFSLAGGFV